ncbi:TPA: DUF1266 domain-containing protein [Klebsiella aerogenes]|nr:DUF1266 domain-containing protein [Klebsiella aerogenes]
MHVKRFRALIALCVLLVAQWQFNFIGYQLAFYILMGILGAFAIYEILRFVVILRLRKQVPDLKLSYLTNLHPRYTLNSESERRAAMASALYLISETTTNGPSTSYVNSLETLDMENADLVKLNRLDIEAAWDISNGDAMREMINELIERAQTYEATSLQVLGKQERYQRYFAGYGLVLSDIESHPVTGFDIVRAAWMVRAGFSIGFLTEEAARGYLALIGELLAKQFVSWESLAVSYLVTYSEWNGGLQDDVGMTMKEYMLKERIIGVKLLLEDSDSPLRQAAFD